MVKRPRQFTQKKIITTYNVYLTVVDSLETKSLQYDDRKKSFVELLCPIQ